MAFFEAKQKVVRETNSLVTNDQRVHRTRPPERDRFSGQNEPNNQLFPQPGLCNTQTTYSSAFQLHRHKRQPTSWCSSLSSYLLTTSTSSLTSHLASVSSVLLILVLFNGLLLQSSCTEANQHFLSSSSSSSSLVNSSTSQLLQDHLYFLTLNDTQKGDDEDQSHVYRHHKQHLHKQSDTFNHLNHHHHHHHSKRQSDKGPSTSGDLPSSDMSTAPSTGASYAYYATSNKSINFTHLEVDPFTGAVYVGAVNWVLQLHAETLRVQHAVRTGPIRDSVFCAPADCSDGGLGEAGGDSSSFNNQQTVVTNTVNKVLLVDPYSRMLIVCGSVHQGACARHRLEDISTHEALVPIPVAANDENSSTIAFVVPARYYGVTLTPILYVAATDSRLGPYRDMVPAISGRSLDPENGRLFNIVERTFADTARVDIATHLRDYFTVRYVYGFAAGDYVYFAAVQRRSHLRAFEETGYGSRLGRVCASDAGFHTYAELTLECKNYEPSRRRRAKSKGRFRSSQTGSGSSEETDTPEVEEEEEFRLLQDAFLFKAGSDLADSLNIERGAQILAGVFSSATDHTQRPGPKSALCLFPVAEIEARFAENIHLCYNGSVYSRNMEYIAGSVNACPEPGVS